MVHDVSKARAVFWDIHRDLPREGPGDRDSTARALRLAEPLPPASRVLDIACGPGAQTLDLAELLPEARIEAVDFHQPFVDETKRRARGQGVDDRVKASRADMRTLGYPSGSFDLIWCEGGAYIMGFAKALRAWRPLLKPTGRLALTEAVWLSDDAPEEVRRFWSDAYPAMTSIEACRTIVRDCGYRLIGDFVLPQAAWWEYYRPKQDRLASLASRYAGDAVAERVLQQATEEIAIYRRYAAYYGYVFLAMEPQG